MISAHQVLARSNDARFGAKDRPDRGQSGLERLHQTIGNLASGRLLASPEPDGPEGGAIARSVSKVLQTPGRPLSPHVRRAFQLRFGGQDFASVRTHSDDGAAQSASDMHAEAYTVGSHIVFARDRYAPESKRGAGLLAHELAHVVQTRGAAIPATLTASRPTDPEELQAARAGQVVMSGYTPEVTRAATKVRLFRACSPALCPADATPEPARGFRWEAAEKCLQDQYAFAHRGNTIGYNKQWLYLNGRTPAERQSLACMKRSFTARSGIFPAEPDIFDFSDNTIYEITTPRLAYSRSVRLQAEVGLATSLTSTVDCGGRSWARGWWSPASLCFEMGGDEFISVMNDNGVLVYTPLVKRRRRRENQEEAAQSAQSQLSAHIDEDNSSLITFSRRVSLQEAVSYIWGNQGVPPDTLTKAPISLADPPINGRQRQFIFNLRGDRGRVLVSRMQHGLDRQWLWASLIKSKAKVTLPDWIPQGLREDILRGRIADGLNEFGGTWPGNYSGNVMVWISTGGMYRDIQVYQEYPDALEFYRRHAEDEWTARLYRDVFTEWNRDMRDLIGRSHYSPDNARGYLRYIHGEILKLVILGAVMMLQAGASVSSINASMARQAASQRQSIGSSVRAGERAGSSGSPPLRVIPGGGQGSGIPTGRLREVDSLLGRPPDQVFDQAAARLRAGGVR